MEVVKSLDGVVNSYEIKDEIENEETENKYDAKSISNEIKELITEVKSKTLNKSEILIVLEEENKYLRDTLFNLKQELLEILGKGETENEKNLCIEN